MLSLRAGVQDVDVREGMTRGSQGSGGILGYNFNVVTGAPKSTGDPHRLPLKSRDPRISRNVTDKEALKLDAWGDVTEHRADIISGKFRPAVSQWDGGCRAGGAG